MQDPVKDAWNAQIAKVCKSRAFRNTEVLKRLLDYLGRQALEGPPEGVKEYQVGIEAFGKPSSYDPKTDSSVRVQASKLRQKLDEYYRTEGAEDPLILELPKGHFHLEFRERQSGSQSSFPAPGSGWRRISIVLAVLLCITAGLAAYFGFRLINPARLVPPWTPEMEEFWQPILTSHRPIVVALGTPLFVKVSDYFFRDPTVNTAESASRSESVKKLSRLLDAPNSVVFPYTGVGEAAGVFGLTRLLALAGRDVSLEVSRNLNWEEIARNNVVFVGPPKFNLPTDDLPFEQHFIIRHARVDNLKPSPGEPAHFDEKRSADGSQSEEGHALVTRVSGLHGAGWLLILAGTSTEGTRAAAEYVSRPEHVSALVRAMHRQFGGVPGHFQAVIRARYKAQTPIAIETVVVRALK